MGCFLDEYHIRFEGKKVEVSYKFDNNVLISPQDEDSRILELIRNNTPLIPLMRGGVVFIPRISLYKSDREKNRFFDEKNRFSYEVWFDHK
jgi:hypothetical protein